MIKRLKTLGQRYFRKEDGAASVEFVMTVPILLLIFVSCFENGLLMIRSIMLDQAVERTVRELRLGRLVNPTQASLKAEVCDRTVIFHDCVQSISIEMTKIDTTTWSFPPRTIQCRDRAQVSEPPLNLVIGQQNDVMLMRVCIPQDAIFPTVGLGMLLPQDGNGGYFLTSYATFVTEPR
jgi:Flp pilus assembly protein TadG